MELILEFYKRPQKEKYDFKGNNDITEFVKLHKKGLWVILRPKSFTMLGMEFGGYPYWLLNEKGLVVSKEKKNTPKLIQLFESSRETNWLYYPNGLETDTVLFGSERNLEQKIILKAVFGILYTCDPRNDIEGHLRVCLHLDKPEDVNL